MQSFVSKQSNSDKHNFFTVRATLSVHRAMYQWLKLLGIGQCWHRPIQLANLDEHAAKWVYSTFGDAETMLQTHATHAQHMRNSTAESTIWTAMYTWTLVCSRSSRPLERDESWEKKSEVREKKWFWQPIQRVDLQLRENTTITEREDCSFSIEAKEANVQTKERENY